MSRICAMLSRVPARPAPGRQMSRISRLSRSNVNKNNKNSNNTINRRSIIQVITLLDHEHTVTGSSVGFLLQSYKYIGSGGLQITATRLPQNAPNRIWNSKNFPGVIPPDPRPGLGKCTGGNPTPQVPQPATPLSLSLPRAPRTRLRQPHGWCQLQ